MEELSFWTDVAVVILGIQCFIMLILAVVLSYVLVRLMHALHGKTEIYAAKVQKITHSVNEKTQEYSEKSIQPVLAIKKQSAHAEHVLRNLFGRD